METTTLQENVVARWREITEDKVWPAPEGDRIIRAFRLGYGAKRMPSREGDDYPFIATKITTGNDTRTNAGLTLIVIVGLYSPVDADGDYLLDDTAVAEGVVAEGVAAVRQLGSCCNYSPFALEGITWQIGDENGDQPAGPGYYLIAAELTFARLPVLNTYN